MKKIWMGIFLCLLCCMMMCTVGYAVVQPDETECQHTQTVIDEAQEATCTESGKTQGEHCADCPAILVEQKTIPALGHNTVIDRGTAPTCTEGGKTAGKHCSRCGEVLQEQEDLPARGHLPFVTPAIEATCTKCGRTEGRHCDICWAILVPQEIIPATGHSIDYSAAVDATCTDEGRKAGYLCEKCGYVCSGCEVIPAKGHSFGEWTGKGGSHRRDCLRSGCAYAQEIPCDYREVTVNGETFAVCLVCGDLAQGDFDLLQGAACKSVSAGKDLPRGKLLVYAKKNPFGAENAAVAGLENQNAPLYALTVCYAYAGKTEEFNGDVQVKAEVSIGCEFEMFALGASGSWSAVEYQYENGVLTFETDRTGLFLLVEKTVEAE